jgi:hypothetical protein
MIKGKNPPKSPYLLAFSLVGSLLFVALFLFINFTTGIQFPWFIFPSFAVLLWPLITLFAGRYSKKLLSLVCSLIIIAELFALNYLTSWGEPWFLYPSFAVIWWPIGVFFGSRYPRALSLIGAVLIIGFITLTNFLESPEYLWAPLAYFPALMWPAGVLLSKHLRKLGVALCGCIAGITYYVAMNIWLFPGFPWAVFVAFALIWWPLVVALAKPGHALSFSLAGSLLVVAFFITTNIITTPDVVWAVYPIFAVSWWPLSVYYFRYRRRKIPG